MKGGMAVVKEGKTIDFRVELATFIGMLFDETISEEDKAELVEMRHEEQTRNKKWIRKK